MNSRYFYLGSIISFALAGASVNAASINMDFNTDALNQSIQAGQIIDDEFASFGITISGDSNNRHRPDKVIAFDSANPTGGDPDLATPGYGLNNNVALGMLLILAERDTDQNNDGFVDNPDDDAGGGYIQFAFDSPQQASGSVDMLDIEEHGSRIDLLLAGNIVNSLSIPGLGDNSFQTISFGLASFDTLRVSLSGSGAIGGVRMDTPGGGPEIPEPATIALFGLGATLIAYRKRSKPTS